MKVAEPLSGTITLELSPAEAVALARELDEVVTFVPRRGQSVAQVIKLWQTLYAAFGVQITLEGT